MKIAICGAQGVGKTTLVNELAKELGFRVLPEVAREMAKAGHKLDQGVTALLEYEMIKMQTGLEEMLGPWIADRSLIDLLAYCVVLFPEDKSLFSIARGKLKEAKYDLIFYIPPEFTIEDDGVRSTDPHFRDKIDQAIKNVLKGYEHHIIR
ncbi:MAG TPA: ATP-binding protein, partial [Nitrosopumilaceae archaeon]|nr:ATP-binding protein [Nitrosopumilaceae archaeon]